MQRYPTLYDKDLRGNIRVWWCERDDNKHRVCSGIENGAIVQSEWTVCGVKFFGQVNERNPIEQAHYEVENLYTRQLKKGYYAEKELAGIPKFIKPMLAIKSQDARLTLSHPENLIIQRKLNGHRCIAKKDGLFTRTGERIVVCPHIEEALKSFFEANPCAFLDGELYNYDYRKKLNELTSIIRKQDPTEEDLARAKEVLQYWIYDGNDWAGHGLHYDNRKSQLDEIVAGLNSPYIRTVQDHDGAKEDHNQVYQSYLMDGEEGVIYRVKNSLYEHKRSKNLIKRKEVFDGEFTIVDIREGNGNWSGRAKIIDLTDGKENFSATFKGTMGEALECLLNKDQWIGKTVTIKYFDVTAYGVPQYAQFDYANCLGGNK
jgi:ATP-dependent DNA ligase